MLWIDRFRKFEFQYNFIVKYRSNYEEGLKVSKVDQVTFFYCIRSILPVLVIFSIRWAKDEGGKTLLMKRPLAREPGSVRAACVWTKNCLEKVYTSVGKYLITIARHNISSSSQNQQKCSRNEGSNPIATAVTRWFLFFHDKAIEKVQSGLGNKPNDADWRGIKKGEKCHKTINV